MVLQCQIKETGKGILCRKTMLETEIVRQPSENADKNHH